MPKSKQPKRPPTKTSFVAGGPNPHAFRKRELNADDVPKGPALLTHLASQGVRDDDLRRVLGIHRADWLEYKSANPEIQDAIDAGRARMHDALVSVLFKNAKKGQLVPALFLLKTQFQYRESDPVDHDEGNRVLIVLPGAQQQEKFIEGQIIAPPEDDNEPIEGLRVVEVAVPSKQNSAAPSPEREPEAQPQRQRSRPPTAEERRAVQEFQDKVGIRTDRNSFDSEAAWNRWNGTR